MQWFVQIIFNPIKLIELKYFISEHSRHALYIVTVLELQIHLYFSYYIYVPEWNDSLGNQQTSGFESGKMWMTLTY